jgi:hypothetical protein
MIRHHDNRTLALDFDAATAARDLGIQRAATRANKVESEWTGQALGMLTAFAAQAGGPFLIEQARAWAEAQGLPPPPDARSWGSVARTAAAKRRIEKVGFAPAASSNCSPKVQWRYAA